MGGPQPTVKSFEINKRLVYGAWERVRANQGVSGVDTVSISGCGGFKEDEKEIGGFAGLDHYLEGYTEAGGTFDADRYRCWKTLGTLRWGRASPARPRHTSTGGSPTS